jgi:hypothetical protein
VARDADGELDNGVSTGNEEERAGDGEADHRTDCSASTVGVLDTGLDRKVKLLGHVLRRW